MGNRLTDDEISDLSPDMWDQDGDELVRTYPFDEYLRGVNFAQMVGEIAQVQNHHPEIIIRYDEVEIRLTSHEEGGITDADIEMAEFIEAEHND